MMRCYDRSRCYIDKNVALLDSHFTVSCLFVCLFLVLLWYNCLL